MLDKAPEIFTFNGKTEGLAFTVLGAIHGNEKCGTRAIERTLAALKDGKIKITKGKLTLVPICNPRAYEQDVRFTERNLNRFFYPKDKPEKYEDHLDNILCPVVKDSDYLLDLHSYTTQGGAFIFFEGLDEKNIAFVKSLKIPRMIYGWATALAKNNDVVDKQQAMGTTEYARENGAYSLTLECGNHYHPRAADVGFQAILNALQFLGMAEIDDSLHINDLPDDGKYTIKMQGAHLKLREGEFTQDWGNLSPVKKGTIVARYKDGEEIIIPDDAMLVLPNKKAAIGHEWFFWGREESV